LVENDEKTGPQFLTERTNQPPNKLATNTSHNVPCGLHHTVTNVLFVVGGHANKASPGNADGGGGAFNL